MRSALLVLLSLVTALPAQAQGFGKIKKKVTLHRRLPAAVHLTGTQIQIKTAARDARGTQAARELADVLEAELLKYDKRLRMEAAKPDTLVSATITSLSVPPPQPATRAGLPGQPAQHVTRVSGQMTLAYQAKDLRTGRVLDSDNLTSKYEAELDETGGKTDKSITSTLKKPWDKIHGGDKSKDEPDAPRTTEDIRQALVRRAALQVAARLVETNEAVEVYLARGKLDEYNRFADGQLWNRMLEPLETMTPLPKKDDDAYRLYNIGVVYEALAYRAEDVKAAKRFFDRAAIHYGKAIDAKPDEKYFVEPQNRIQTAIAHYKKLEERAAPTRTAAAAPPSSPRSAEPGKTKAGAGPLTNEAVIRLAKAGLDEENLIATIRQAPAVNFDFGVDALVELSTNGVKGKVLTAMRERAARRPPAKTTTK